MFQSPDEDSIIPEGDGHGDVRSEGIAGLFQSPDEDSIIPECPTTHLDMVREMVRFSPLTRIRSSRSKAVWIEVPEERHRGFSPLTRIRSSRRAR